MELEQDRFLLAKAAMSSEIENRNDDWPKTFQKKVAFRRRPSVIQAAAFGITQPF